MWDILGGIYYTPKCLTNGVYISEKVQVAHPKCTDCWQLIHQHHIIGFCSPFIYNNCDLKLPAIKILAAVNKLANRT